jgi:hypothetical protein
MIARDMRPKMAVAPDRISLLAILLGRTTRGDRPSLSRRPHRPVRRDERRAGRAAFVATNGARDVRRGSV